MTCNLLSPMNIEPAWLKKLDGIVAASKLLHIAKA